MLQRGQEHPGAMQPDAAPVPRKEVGTVGVLGEVLIFAFAGEDSLAEDVKNFIPQASAPMKYRNLYPAYVYTDFWRLSGLNIRNPDSVEVFK